MVGWLKIYLCVHHPKPLPPCPFCVGLHAPHFCVSHHFLCVLWPSHLPAYSFSSACWEWKTWIIAHATASTTIRTELHSANENEWQVLKKIFFPCLARSNLHVLNNKLLLKQCERWEIRWVHNLESNCRRPRLWCDVGEGETANSYISWKHCLAVRWALTYKLNRGWETYKQRQRKQRVYQRFDNKAINNRNNNNKDDNNSSSLSPTLNHSFYL